MAFDDKEYAKAYYQKNKDKAKERAKKWREDNPERYKEQNSSYYEENKECTLAKNKEDRKNNKEKYKEKEHKKYLKHKEKIIARVAEYNKTSELRPIYLNAYRQERAVKDIQFYMQRALRSGLYNAVKLGRMPRKKEYVYALTYLGCEVPEFKSCIESKFTDGMAWENWGKGKGKWQLDHIKPLCSFDLTNQEHLSEVCHHSNIQPLWHDDNMKKGPSLPIGMAAKRVHIRKQREAFSVKSETNIWP